MSEELAQMNISEYVYRASNGESFDSVARAIWGDEIYAAELLAVNPECDGKLIFYGGEMLRIPELDIPDATGDEITKMTKAPWKE